MKKHNVLLFVLSVIFIICLAGCKSLPAGQKVDSLSLLDADKAFYFSVPKEVDSDLFYKTIQTSVEGISEKDAKKLSGYLSHVYAGINFHKRGKTLQVAVDSTIPRKFIPSVLSKKNGWTNKEYKIESSQNKYFKYLQNQISLSFPSDNIICLSDSEESVESMLQTYDFLYNQPLDTDISSSYKISDEISFWLKGSDSEIRFYSLKPQVLLTQFIGIDLDLKLKTLKGAIIKETENSSIYDMDLVFEFQSPKYLKASRSLVMMTFGLNSQDVTPISDTSFEIKGMTLNKDKLLKILVP